MAVNRSDSTARGKFPRVLSLTNHPHLPVVFSHVDGNSVQSEARSALDVACAHYSDMLYMSFGLFASSSGCLWPCLADPSRAPCNLDMQRDQEHMARTSDQDATYLARDPALGELLLR